MNASVRSIARLRLRWSLVARVAALVTGLLVAGCQATSTQDVLNVVQELPNPPRETIGTGPVMVSMLLPRSAQPPLSTRARDFADGARLAVNELGGGLIKLAVYDTAGSENAATAAEQAVATETRLMVIQPGTERLDQILVQKPRGVPVIALGDQASGTGIYAFTSDYVDSAIDGARAAISAGQSQVLAIVPQDLAASDRDRFANGIARHGGRLVGTIDYPPVDAQIGPVLKAEQARFQHARTVVIFGSGRAPAAIAEAIVAQGLASNITTLVGNSGWPRELYSAPVLDGALIAMPDQDSFKEIAGRYQAAAGRPLTLDAALAYDAVAIASGLVAQRGAAGLTANALTADAGFRGATGLFRFRKDGSIERRHTIYRIEKGQLSLLQGDGGGF